ncbi:MAG: hypothetical protein BWY82_02107 [Verrucomicrobia bacterium ADurb.Bin474]|nr:MAG: hypothetical protein BWY82_02107 [Verrucomicrobia bacterium ADurb.Bin474]
MNELLSVKDPQSIACGHKSQTIICQLSTDDDLVLSPEKVASFHRNESICCNCVKFAVRTHCVNQGPHLMQRPDEMPLQHLAHSLFRIIGKQGIVGRNINHAPIHDYIPELTLGRPELLNLTIQIRVDPLVVFAPLKPPESPEPTGPYTALAVNVQVEDLPTVLQNRPRVTIVFQNTFIVANIDQPFFRLSNPMVHGMPHINPRAKIPEHRDTTFQTIPGSHPHHI